MGRKFSLLLVVTAGALPGAEPSLAEILQRIERLEAENVHLRDEVRTLRERLDGPVAPVEERIAVQERRLEEQEQKKVESSERVPVKLTGMLLFNLYSAGRNGQPLGWPTVATANRGQNQFRGTMRQTMIGLDVESPVSIAGARARGEVMMDFYGSIDDYPAPRLRTGFLDLDWSRTGVRFGIEKAIVAPRNPTSLAQILWPPLWGSGNLWIWEPQFRLEQRFQAGGTDVTIQGGVFQTDEARLLPAGTIESNHRPGWQTRWQFSRRFNEERVLQIAPGFHYSRSFVASTSVPSQLITGDWLFAPSSQFEFTGAFFHGRNAGGVGGLRQGVVILGPGNARSVATTGGWGQLMYKPLDRVRVHAMAGEQDDRDRDLLNGQIGRNRSWALNSIFQLSPNVLLGLEFQQIRTTYIGTGTRVLNRYDLALGYLF
jgi:hypothetical protein